MKKLNILQKFLLFSAVALGGAVNANAQLNNNGGSIVVESGAVLIAAGADGGIEWPAPAPYGTALDDVFLTSSSRERIAVGIVIEPMLLTCVPGPQGPTYHSGLNSPGAVPIPAYIKFVRNGKATFVPVDLLLEVRNTDPAPISGELQLITSEILSMTMIMPAGGHPYFTNVSCVVKPGGTGRTTLRPAAGGGFYADSFFDIVCDFSAVGAAGGEFEGVVLNGSAPVRLRQSLDAFDGLRFEAIAGAEVSSFDGCLQVENLGSSGQDGVRFFSKKGYDHYQAMSASIAAPASGLLGVGQVLAMYPFPPPPLPDLPTLPARSVVCTNTGGVVSGVCSSNAVRASEWLVEVWEGRVLKAVGVAPDESACWSIPAGDFRPNRISCSVGSGRTRGRASTSLSFDGATEVTISGNATPVTGDRVSVSPRNPEVILSGIDRVDILSSSGKLCIEQLSVTEFEMAHQGLGNAAITTRGRSLVLDNIGSSGQDGVSVAVNCDCCDDDCDGITTALPYRAELTPVDVERSGGSFWVSSNDASGNNVATAEYQGGGGAGGRILVDYNTASTVCRVTVLNDGQVTGEFDVTLAPNGQTEVCAIGAGTLGHPLLKGCGKLRIGYPWELSCLVEEFDRAVVITPTGGSPLLGDEVRLLAPGATAQEVQSIREIQMRASGVSSFEICGESIGPDFPPAPQLPPASTANFEFPGKGTRLMHGSNSYFTIDPATGEAVCVKSSLSNFVRTGSNGGRTNYSATLTMEINGVGGLNYSRVLELPGGFSVELGQNNFVDQDVQQYSFTMPNFDFALPAGDPDFSTLRVRQVAGGGLGSSGDVIVRKIPECVFEIEGLEEILAQLELVGAPGGGLNGVSVTGDYHETWKLVQPETVFSGFPHRGNGAGQVTVGAAGLDITNIGSSGQDGASIILPHVESFALNFDEERCVRLGVGGEMEMEMANIGSISGGGAAGKCRFFGTLMETTTGQFFDLNFDLSAIEPESTVVEIYSGGALVAQMPGGGATVSVKGSLPTIGVIPGIVVAGVQGRSTPGHVVRFESPLSFQVLGQPAATGDEIRVVGIGTSSLGITRCDLSMSGTNGPVLVISESADLFGRPFSTQGMRATDYNSSRSNRTTSAFNPDCCDPDDDNDGVLEFRAPLSTVLNDRQQTWPMRVNFGEGGVPLSGAGSSVRYEALGTINGKTNTSYGKIVWTWVDGGIELSGDFSSRSTNLVAISVIRELDKASTKMAEAVVSTNNIAHVVMLNGQSGPRAVSAVPELYEPPFQEIECSYGLLFDSEVEVTIPGIPAVKGNKIEIRLINPTFVSESVSALRVSGTGIKTFVVEGVGTGPFSGHGLVHETVGSAQIEEADVNTRGPLTVSNIGSSGQDGVRVRIHEANGIWNKVSPISVSANKAGSLQLSNYKLQAGPIYVLSPPDSIHNPDNDCDGTVDGRDDDCDGISASLTATPGSSVLELNIQGFFDSVRVVGTRSGGFGSAVSVSSDGSYLLAGTITPQAGSNGDVVGYGVLPSTVIDGAGLVGRCIAIEFDGPVVFAPAGGGSSIVCDVLRICPADGSTEVGSQRVFETRFAGLASVTVLETELLHLHKHYTSLGVAEIAAEGEALHFDNLGSSGLDGVRANGGPRMQQMMQMMQMSVSAPEPDEGFPGLGVEAHGVSGGVPDSPLGESSISLGSTGTTIPVSATFAALSAPNVRVVVCDGRDDDCDGLVTSAAGTVCVVQVDAASPAGVVGYGYSGGGIFWEFNQLVEITPLGGAPGSGVMGNRVYLYPDGGPIVDTEMLSLDLLSSGVPEITFLDSSTPDSYFDTWLEENFTEAEISQLDAADYDLDSDGDSYSEVEEFILGFDPKMRNDAGHKPSHSFATVVDPAGGEDESYFRMSFEFDPDKQGVELGFDISEDLSNWTNSTVVPNMIVAPDMWRRVEKVNLPNGNQRQTWERTDPVSAHIQEIFRHRGHVTVLK